MGDVVLATSLFSYVKEHEPQAEVHFLTGKTYADLFAADPRLASVTGIDNQEDQPALAQLAQKRFDLIVDLQNSSRSRRLRKRYFAGAQTGLFDKLHFNRFLLLVLRVGRYDARNDVARRYARACGIGNAAQTNIPSVKVYPKMNAGALAALFGASRASASTLALCPFSAWRNKQWPAERFAAVGRHFSARGWNIVVCGGPGDRIQAEALQHAIGANCVAVSDGRPLSQMAAVFSQCSLALGNDTGLSHLAHACGVKTGVIFGSTTRDFGFFPFGEPAFKVFEKPLACRPCHAHGGNLCYRFFRPCLGRISTQLVIKEMENLGALPAARGAKAP
jgi:heptosyltransferase II